jgi:undecaprenyl-diphosphatase
MEKESSHTAIILLFLMFLLVFQLIAWDWWRCGPSARLDAAILQYTERLVAAHPRFIQFLNLAGILGKSFCLAAAVILGGIFLARKKDWPALSFLLIMTVLGCLLLEPVKDWFQRPRPLPDLPGAKGFSFPSGNAYYSFLVYGSLAFFLSPHASRWWSKSTLILGAAAAVTLVGMSRLALRLHWLTDILGAYALAGSWLLISILAYRKIKKK